MTASTHRVLQRGAGAQVPNGLCALAIMTKAPRAGRVKTRLQPPLTPQEAAELNICFLRDTATAIAEASRLAPAKGVGVYTPVGAESDYVGILPEHFFLVAQRGGDFGERLSHATEDLLEIGFQSVCLIDSDSPTVPVAAYVAAASMLAAEPARMVFGPSDDGGYYLIGMSSLHRRVFQEVDWSTARVADQTLERAKEIGLEVHFLPTWYDVDDAATLRRLHEELFLRERGEGFLACATKDYLARVLNDRL